MFDGADTVALGPQPFFVGSHDWPRFAERVRPHLERMAAGSSGRFEADDVGIAIAAGRFQLWLALDGNDICCVMLTEINQFPRLREMRLIGLVGHRPRRWLHLLQAIEIATRVNFGCQRIACLAPHRMTRLLRTGGWRMFHVLVEKDLV